VTMVMLFQEMDVQTLVSKKLDTNVQESLLSAHLFVGMEGSLVLKLVMIITLVVILFVITRNHIGNVQEDPFLYRRHVTAYVRMDESLEQKLVMMELKTDLAVLQIVEERKVYGNAKEEVLQLLQFVSFVAMVNERLMKLVTMG